MKVDKNKSQFLEELFNLADEETLGMLSKVQHLLHQTLLQSVLLACTKDYIWLLTSLLEGCLMRFVQ